MIHPCFPAVFLAIAACASGSIALAQTAPREIKRYDCQNAHVTAEVINGVPRARLAGGAFARDLRSDEMLARDAQQWTARLELAHGPNHGRGAMGAGAPLPLDTRVARYVSTDAASTTAVGGGPHSRHDK